MNHVFESMNHFILSALAGSVLTFFLLRLRDNTFQIIQVLFTLMSNTKKCTVIFDVKL